MLTKRCILSIFFGFIFLFFFSGSGFSNENKILLNKKWVLRSSVLIKEKGDRISSPDFQPESWYSVDIPSTVLTALVKHGIYPDPYIGFNNMKIPDASPEFNQKYDLGKYSHLPDKRNPWAEPYWYWTRFRLPKEYKGKHTWLHFDGINYRAEVWLNGNLVANSKIMAGMFGKWFFDVTQFARIDQVNTLAVKIFPLDYPGLPGEPQLKAFGPFGLNGGDTGDIGKNVTMQSSVGWDWLPAVRDRNMGIWQDVYLSLSGPVDIRDPFIKTDLPLPDLDRAELEISGELINLTNTVQKGTLVFSIQPNNFEGSSIIIKRTIELAPNQIKYILFDAASHKELRIKNPKLWWPNGMGGQNLYTLELRFEQNHKVSDSEKTMFGIREIETTLTKQDKWARRDFFINGKKVMIKGGAWVPDMMLNRSQEKLRHELLLSKAANLNMVRIWGGGVTPPSSFFNICDEFGLFVWHDFWITGDCQATWGKGSRDYPFEEEVFLSNAATVVKQIRNHPSLLLWTAGNEGYPRKEIYSPLRNDILSKLDGTRPFIPTSGHTTPPESWGLSWPDNQASGTDSGGPYCWVDPVVYYEKVALGKDWLFKNEVGLPSLPPLESLKKFIPDLAPHPDVNFPLNHAWGYHDACEGNGKYSLYDQAIRSRYGEPKTLEDYLMKGQLINAESYRAIFESVNSARDKTAGVILWKTNPAWPSVIWQLYDWYLRPNAGYYFTQKACEPLHIQLNLDDMNVCVVNNRLEGEKNLHVSAQVFSMDMRKIWSMEKEIEVNPLASREIFSVDLNKKHLDSVYFVNLLLRDDRGDILSENLYWFSPDNNFSSLSQLPQVTLKTDIQLEEKDGWIICHINLENPSASLAFFANPAIQTGKQGGEILPSFWSDNYFSVLPNESKEVLVKIQKQHWNKNGTFLKIEGWNIISSLIKIPNID